MLSSNTLFFCNAFNFEDKYEGEIPLSFFEGWSKESEKNYRQFNILKNKVYVPYVSCWTPYQPGNKKCEQSMQVKMKIRTVSAL